MGETLDTKPVFQKYRRWHVWRVLQWLFRQFTGLVIGKSWCSCFACSRHHLRTSFWAITGGFPTALVMCAAGDGGHATLILHPSSGKYPASLCRVKTTKGWVWLQPPGFSAPTRTCPRVTACCSLLPIYPCMTLLTHGFSLWSSFQPGKSTYDCGLPCNVPAFSGHK